MLVQEQCNSDKDLDHLIFDKYLEKRVRHRRVREYLVGDSLVDLKMYENMIYFSFKELLNASMRKSWFFESLNRA